MSHFPSVPETQPTPERTQTPRKPSLPANRNISQRENEKNSGPRRRCSTNTRGPLLDLGHRGPPGSKTPTPTQRIHYPMRETDVPLQTAVRRGKPDTTKRCCNDADKSSAGQKPGKQRHLSEEAALATRNPRSVMKRRGEVEQKGDLSS